MPVAVMARTKDCGTVTRLPRLLSSVIKSTGYRSSVEQSSGSFLSQPVQPALSDLIAVSNGRLSLFPFFFFFSRGRFLLLFFFMNEWVSGWDANSCKNTHVDTCIIILHSKCVSLGFYTLFCLKQQMCPKTFMRLCKIFVFKIERHKTDILPARGCADHQRWMFAQKLEVILNYHRSFDRQLVVSVRRTSRCSQVSPGLAGSHSVSKYGAAVLANAPDEDTILWPNSDISQGKESNA